VATNKLTSRDTTIVYWTCILFGIRINCPNPEVGTLIGWWVYSSCLIGGISFSWLLLATCLSFLLEINGSYLLILK